MIHLTDDMRDRLATALTDGYPVVAGSVDSDGQPHLSFFGTTQVFGPSQLAIWVRNSATGFLQRISSNPKVAFIYRNPRERVMYQFQGRARPTTDEEARRAVFDHSPEIERSLDPDRKGVAVLIDIELVKGRAHGEPIEQTRDE